MSPGRAWLLLTLALAACNAGCFTLSPCNGGGQNVTFKGTRRLDTADVALPDGYAISIVARKLDFPTGVCCDDDGVVYVIESGNDPAAPQPRLLRIDDPIQVIATGTAGPWTAVCYYKGNFYVAQNDPDGGRILKISPDGKMSPILENLPSLGDYPTTSLRMGPDGWLYFAQGSATNSGVVGPDDDEMGLFPGQRWLTRHRRFHDFPGADVKLSGYNAQTHDPFDPNATKITGPYSPFGEPTAPGQVVSGQVPCTGGIMRIPITGGPPELVAWGFRNPAGLALTSDGRLYATEQSYEDRGSRPVAGAGDLLWEIHTGLWYGWPDYFGTRPLAGTRQFAAIGKPPPQALLANPPNPPQKPAAILPLHGMASGIDFSHSDNFGYAGQAFIAEFGDLAPVTGKLLYPVGFEVARVDVDTGVRHAFATNRGPIDGPASKFGAGGLERPIAVRFSPSGETLYVLDFGVVTVSSRPQPWPGTGVLWKITKKNHP